MKCLFCLHFIFFIVSTLGSGNHNIKFKKGAPIIGVSNGYLHGKIEGSRGDRLYFAFRGIPYAETPIRFEDSRPKKNWEGLKTATEFGHSCPQKLRKTGEIIGDEDCLFLNVYFPKDIDYETKVPVMVYIDGMEFMEGGGDRFGPKYFMDEDIVLITLNSRIGVLGFLNTEDKEVTGNMGMKDIVLALKWIQKEIALFGGNRSKVTIFGHGSGAAAVHYLILSPLAKDLFHFAISQSGTALNPFAFSTNPSQSARKLGEKLDCPLENSATLVKCLRIERAAEIVSAQINDWSSGSVYRFAPSVDTLSSEVFLPAKPYDLIAKGKHSYIPWIVGGNDDEGYQLTQEIKKNSLQVKLVKDEWNSVAPDLLEYRNSVPEHELDQISQQIWTAYFSETNDITTTTLGTLLSDRQHWLGYKTSAFYYSKISKAYAYVFAATENVNLPDLLFQLNRTEDITSNNKIEDKNLSKAVIKLWTSFANTGEPTQTWNPEIEWRYSPSTRIGINAPMKWYYIANKTRFLSDDAERLYFWHMLPLNEFKVSETVPIKDEF